VASHLVIVAGNPNAGKTTLFNSLTGSTQKVANYPGVTVESVEGQYSFDGESIRCVDWWLHRGRITD
jgi:ferrous iron transport protein B